jgi:TRAP-type C4-dicarboxylate transport system substrate-binding protein
VRATAVALLVAWAAPARAEPHVLRMASSVPEGTAWARLLRTYSREVEAATAGEVKVKWYLGGIAGDELQVGDRIRRDQLDGAAASVLCQKLAASTRVTRVIGLLRDRDEATYVLSRLKPIIDDEFHKSGFVNLTQTGLGSEVLFTRRPVRSLDELKKVRLWTWDIDDGLRAQLPALGLSVVPLPVEEAARAYDEQRVDGFIALPSAALAFQWSAQSRYLTDLRLGYLSSCLIVAERAFDPLPITAQAVLREAAAQLDHRLEQLGREQDQALLGGLLERQGLRLVPVPDALHNQFFEVAARARERLPETVVPEWLILRVASWLADYRAVHATETRR